MGQSQDNVIYMPLTLFKKHIAPSEDIGIFVSPRAASRASTATTDEVRTILRAVRKTKFDKDDPFGLVDGGAAAEPLASASRQGAFLLMILISGISLVVGAIVIANIMFVSVVERTKEIGAAPRRSARARRTSAASSSSRRRCCRSVGGVIGVILGSLIALAVNQVFPAQVRLSVHPPRRRRGDRHGARSRGWSRLRRRASCRRSKPCATSRASMSSHPRPPPPRLRRERAFRADRDARAQAARGADDPRHRRRRDDRHRDGLDRDRLQQQR